MNLLIVLISSDDILNTSLLDISISSNINNNFIGYITKPDNLVVDTNGQSE